MRKRRKLPRPQLPGGGQWRDVERLPRILSNREPKSDQGRQMVMKAMAWSIAGAIIVAVGVSGCGSSPPTTGVVTGRVAACTLVSARHRTTVTVYDHERLVATQRLQGSEPAFRFSLPAGSYVVKDANGSKRVVVSNGRITHVPELLCF